MTSSIRDGSQQDRNVREYKPHDPFEEPGLISILFLSCGKHVLTRTCFDRLVESTRLYDGEVEWIFAENGQDKDNLSMYESFICDRKKIINTNRNWGINVAFNDMYRIARGEFCVEMENDWWATDIEYDWLARSLDIMRHDHKIGIVQLRSIYDPYENFGLNKRDYNIWSVGDYKSVNLRGHEYLVAHDFYGWNHNPHLARKTATAIIYPLSEPTANSDPRHGETLAQEIFRNTGWSVAHINRRLFEHVGGTLRGKYEALYEM